jgi:DNA (cytosine-5)-methyltransferase 1
MNYYNEFDPYAAQWLRNLIDAGHLPKGEVDSRSIKDVSASDLNGFVQCHFFAGLGGWSHALRLAGWPEDRPVWTGSCPCQPFSAAGAGGGVTDERHLWPVWFNLIRKCKPHVIFGEQVEAAINHGWLDLVQSDLEGEGYACGAVGIPAGCVGAPHIRQRLWFVADTVAGGRASKLNARGGNASISGGEANGQSDCGVGELADSQREGLEGHIGDERNRDEPGRVNAQPPRPITPSSGVDQLGNTTSLGRKMALLDSSSSNAPTGVGQTDVRGGRSLASPTNGFWSDCDWLPCRDGKARPVEPGTFPLAHGVSGRVGRLRAYGNAIVPQVAHVFIEAYLES